LFLKDNLSDFNVLFILNLFLKSWIKTNREQYGQLGFISPQLFREHRKFENFKKPVIIIENVDCKHKQKRHFLNRRFEEHRRARDHTKPLILVELAKRGE
jgi:hypothetical protein